MYILGTPSAPRNLRVVEVYRDYIVVAWDPPEHDGGDSVSGYVIEKTVSGNVFVNAGAVSASTTSFKLTKLYENNEYMIRVMAENRLGVGQAVTTERPVKAKLPYGEHFYFLFIKISIHDSMHIRGIKKKDCIACTSLLPNETNR